MRKFGLGVNPYLARYMKENSLALHVSPMDRLKMDAKTATVKKSKSGEKGGKAASLAEERAELIEKMSGRIDEGDPVEDLRSYVHKLALNFVKDGITREDTLLGKVHAVLKEIVPEITESESRQLYSDYGEYKELDKDPFKKTFRGLRGEAQLKGKRGFRGRASPEKKRRGTGRIDGRRASAHQRSKRTQAERQLYRYRSRQAA
jgi:hypothetical protein